MADIDPVYLPDGQIVFASTRDTKYCGCNQHIQANLFRMHADGSNIHQIGRNNLFESRPSLMPDGRILYDRWEYVDRHFGPSFGLWTSAPDGCNHALFYGNNAWSPGAIFDAQMLPDSQLVIATLGACHDRPWGALAIIDRRRGLDGEEPLVKTWPPDIKEKKYLSNDRQYNQGQEQRHPVVDQIDLFQELSIKYEDPFPLDEHFFLCSRMTGNGEQTGIYLIDTFGNELLLYAEDVATGLGCFDPRPMTPRKRPPVVPDRVDLTQKSGTFYVADIYQGTAMKDVPRGAIKKIRVVEAPPKRYYTHPLWQMDTLQRPAMNYNCTNNKRILGDAPVESDGSAYFEVPADRFVFFQALDANGQMVQSMRSGTTLRPGENTGCIGCHDRRYDSVNTAGLPVTIAMRRDPSKLKSWYGPTREFNYLTEVQPVFDRYCVSCHDYGKEAGETLNLAGDLGLAFNTSYLELRKRSPLRWFSDKPGEKKQLIKAVDDGPPEVLPPYAWGSHRSRLIDVVRGDHYDVKLDAESFDRIVTWIDLNAPYYGSYASNYPGNLFGRSPLNSRQLSRLANLTGVAVATETPGHPLQGTQVNFTRPEFSPCLNTFKGEKEKQSERYREALSIIEKGRETLRHTTRADMPNFTLFNKVDQQRHIRYLKKQINEASSRLEVVKGAKQFDEGYRPKLANEDKLVRLGPIVFVEGKTHADQNADKGFARPQLLRPVDVPYASGSPFLQGDFAYEARLAIDGDPATFCCLWDDTLTGDDAKTLPPRAAAPVTGHMIFDLGRPYLLTGIQLTSRQHQGNFTPKNIDLFYFADDQPGRHTLVDDLEHDPAIKPLVQGYSVPAFANGANHTVPFNGVVARYIGLRVNDSYESGNGGIHYNFQFAEVNFIGREKPAGMAVGSRLPPLYVKKNSLSATMLAVRKRYQEFGGTTSAVEELWKNLRRDFPADSYPLLDEVHYDWFDSQRGWFASSHSTKFEEQFINRLLGVMETCVGPSADLKEQVAHFKANFKELQSTMASPDDPRWLSLCMAMVPVAETLQDLDRLRQAVNELGEAYPDDYPSAAILAQIETLMRRGIALLKEDATVDRKAWDTIHADLAKLKRHALVEESPLLKHRKILFAKRHAYCPGWYYADFNYATHFGGNLCVLSLDTGDVDELVPELDGGIFDRFDLSFDAQRIVFGYKKARGHGFRLYEVGVDGTGLRQITTAPADEAQRIAKYHHPAYGENGAYQHHTDDFHPCYLPDGGICFTSTRCERGVLCDQPDHLSVNTLYRVERDGSNMQPLSEGALSESAPSVANDGRILYTRWEYVDKGVIAVQSLWMMRPDGSGTVEVFGGQHDFPPVLIHARAVPGQNHLFVATSTMHHPFAVGPIQLINTRYPLLTHEPLTNLTPDTGLWTDGLGSFPRGEQYTHLKNGRFVPDNKGPLFADPYPLTDPKTGECSASFFLVTCNPDRPWNDRKAYGLYLIDKFGNRVQLYNDPAISCWQPMVLEPRRRPPVLPSLIGDQEYIAETSSPSEDSVETSAPHGEATVALSNIYEGLQGVEPGTVKYLRIWEQIPRPWSARRFWPHDETLGQHAVISLNAHIYVKVLLGVVPVEEDGSAYFTVPADKNVFFQALDENYMEVQRMRTFVNFQPGERRSCVGCHVTAQTAPSNVAMAAMSRPPSAPSSQPGETAPRPIHYITDIQPIFDRHCVECHNEQRPDGQLDLSGELTTFFNRSYEQIMKKNLVAHVQEFQGPQPRAQKTNTVSLPPYSLGSHASPLVQVLRKDHYHVKLSQSEWIKLITWVDANGPYYGSYFGRRNLMYREHPDFRPVPTLESAEGQIPEARKQ